MLARYSLFTYLIFNFLFVFVLPSYLVWKRTGVSPITFAKSDNAHDYIGRVFKVLMLFVLLVGATQAFYPEGLSFLGPIDYLETRLLQMGGGALLVLSLLWIAVAQYQMSDSWRIGIDEHHKTELVTTGIFRISRNPIFLGMITMLLGLFLVLPNALTFSILVTGSIVIQIQVRLEEPFLKAVHGAVYQDYCNKTRRWI